MRRPEVPAVILKAKFIPLILLWLLLLSACGERSFQASVSASADATSPQKSSPPFFEGQRTVEVEPFILPPTVAVQKRQDDPDHLKDDLEYQMSESAKKLQLEGLGFTVDLDHKKMRFHGRLSSQGRVIEDVNLEGDFNPLQSPWRSDNLFPVDHQVLGEKRMQATAVCLDENICDQVAVRFFYRYNGELLVLQFEKKVLTLNPPKTSSSTLEEALTEKVQTPPTSVESGKEEQEKEKPKTKETSPQVETTTEEDSSLELPQPGNEDDEANDALDDEEEEELPSPLRKVVEEYSAPTQTPSPVVTKDSVQGIEKYTNLVINDAVAQAIGKHTAGRLQQANMLPLDGAGYTRRDRSSSKQVYGTQFMLDLIQKAAQAADKQFPGRPPVSVGNISKKLGGKAGHASHQTGLDVDIAFPRRSSKSTQFWSPLQGGGLSGDMDTERFWSFTKNLVCAKRASNGDSKTVIAIFVDRQIKAQICRFAQEKGEDLKHSSSCAYQTLRSFYHWAGHKNHIHVRLHCPPTVGCKESQVTLPPRSGC